METNRTSVARRHNNSAITASKTNVVQQAKLMDSAGTAWHAVKYGNLEMITKLFPGQCNVYSKGPVGENVFHVAMLLNTPSTLAIAKYLIKLYGKALVNTPYQERKAEQDPPGLYEGETALHIAIVNRDFDMVKFLVQNGADVRARAYGGFFQPGSPAYFGEFPLSFAACTGQKDIVSYLKRHGAQVNQDLDMSGNSALHMCVYHDQMDMYDHLVEFCGASEHIRNHRSQTPLILASSLGKVESFQHIYTKRRRVAWAYGPVTSYSLSLREIDSVQNLDTEYIPSAVETFVRKGHLDALSDPLVMTLLSTKWARFASYVFAAQATLYLVLVLSQVFLIWLICDRTMWNTWHREAMEVSGIVLAGLLTCIEGLDVVSWVQHTFLRRSLMTTARKYKPPLYPIPGEKYDEKPERSRSSFLTTGKWGKLLPSWLPGRGKQQEANLAAMSSASTGPNSAPQSGAVAEGATVLQGFEGEQKQQQAANQAASGASLRLGWRLHWGQRGGGISSRGSGHHSGDDDDIECVGGGSERQPASLLLPLEDVATVAAAGLVLPGDLPVPGVDVAAIWSAQHSADSTAPAGFAAPPAAATATAVAAGTAVRAAGPVAEGLELNKPFASSPSLSPGSAAHLQSIYTRLGSAASRSASANPSLLPLPALAQDSPRFAGSAAAVSEPPSDIVSVGLGMLSGGSHRFAGGASPFATAQSMHLPMPPPLLQPVTSMISIPTAGTQGGANDVSSPMGPISRAGTQGLPNAAGGNALLHSNTMGNQPYRRGESHNGSEINASVQGEGIKNRIRGGGGGDMPASSLSLKRAETNRTDMAGKEAAAGPQGGEAEEEEEAVDLQTQLNTRGRLLRHALRSYVVRQLRDPMTLVVVFHLTVTFVHFITWASTWGGVGGAGSSNVGVRQFDDIIVAMMAVSGWMALLYFTRGFQNSGTLEVTLEQCALDVLKFICLFILALVGFDLAFYVLHIGTTTVAQGGVEPQFSNENWHVPEPFRNIGYGMIQLVRFMYGEAEWDPYAQSQYSSKRVFATIFFVLYVALVLLLLLHTLTAMVVHTYFRMASQSEKVWRLRWAAYVLRCEARLPLAVQQRFRLGEVAYDPALQCRIYNHVFEVVEDVAAEEKERDASIKALESALDKLKKHPPGSAAGASKK